jgi:cytochrome b subunit of formate dehydrogenase
MKRGFTALILWFVGAVTLAQPVKAPRAPTNEDCLTCHEDPDAKRASGTSVFLAKEKFAASVHGEAGLACVDCHADLAATADFPHEEKLAPAQCASCHDDAVAAYSAGVHALARLKAAGSRAATCASCHGDPHSIVPRTSPDSPITRSALPKTCGQCHGVKFVMEPAGYDVSPFFNYQESIHGRAVAQGSQKAAVCTDCHNAHDVRTGKDPKSTIFKFNVPATCGNCHAEETKQFLASVHGKALERGNWQSPVCTDCHGIHLIKDHLDPASSVSSQAVAQTTCAQCHEGVRLTQEFGVAAQRVSSYRGSYHGLASRIGADVAANCASCHGVHNILPSSDPRSMISKANLEKTCGTCHPGAGANFAKGTVHLGVPESQDIGSKATRWVRAIYVVLIAGTIGFMLLHNGLAWWRKAAAKRRRKDRVVVRMNAVQRAQHFILLTSFIALVLSGFALAWPDSWLAWLLGSNESVRRTIHRVAGAVMIVLSLFHVAYMTGTREGRQGIKDFWFRGRDLRDLFGNLRYFLGRTDHRPGFARFTYAEKIEYWALVWGTAVMGVTGLMLWFKVQFGSWIPRWWLDIATAIHFWEAVLATLAIVVWHLYQVIFEPDVYPMNWAWWDGRMTEEEYAHEHRDAFEAERRSQPKLDPAGPPVKRGSPPEAPES